MNRDEVTPMILTFNEDVNIARVLVSLSWASRILIVDSFSTDGTLAIAAMDPRVCVVQRRFDHFAEQCNFGLSHIHTDWVLSLDADYIVDSKFADELESLDNRFEGFRASFRYAVSGKILRGALYPPRTVLYRKDRAVYNRDGHAHRVEIDGRIGELTSCITHDDRKPLKKWFASQITYAESESQKLLATHSRFLNWKDRTRRWIFPAPILTLIYCLFVKGLILDGWAGWFYTLQRVFAEIALSLFLIQNRFDSVVANAKTRKDGD